MDNRCLHPVTFYFILGLDFIIRDLPSEVTYIILIIGDEMLNDSPCGSSDVYIDSYVIFMFCVFYF